MSLETSPKSKKYQIILADPPWSYNDKMIGHQGAETHYRTMNNKDICALPIQELSDKNCCLFMWATSPLLLEAFEVIKSWGFKFKTVAFCWNKQSKNGKWISNMGRWTMGNVEICLLGVKGHPKRVVKNIKQLVIAERKRHSEKPQEIRNRIVQLMGDLPRVELFARQKTEGWDCVGNDINGKDIRQELEKMINGQAT